MSNPFNYGLTEHMDKRGTPCAYCGKPSVMTLIVEPPNAGKLLDTRVGLCEDHKREPEPPLPTRRKPAEGVEHLKLDCGDGKGGDWDGREAA